MPTIIQLLRGDSLIIPNEAIQKLKDSVYTSLVLKLDREQYLQRSHLNFHSYTQLSQIIQECDVGEGGTLLMFWGCERVDSRANMSVGASSCSSIAGAPQPQKSELRSIAQQTDISCWHNINSGHASPGKCCSGGGGVAGGVAGGAGRLADVVVAGVLRAARRSLALHTRLGLRALAQQTGVYKQRERRVGGRRGGERVGGDVPDLLRRRVLRAAREALRLPRHRGVRASLLSRALAAAGRHLLLRALQTPLRRHQESQVVVGAVAGRVVRVGAGPRAGLRRVARGRTVRVRRGGHCARTARLRRAAGRGGAPRGAAGARRQHTLLLAHRSDRRAERAADDVDAAEGAGAPGGVARLAGRGAARAHHAARRGRGPRPRRLRPRPRRCRPRPRPRPGAPHRGRHKLTALRHIHTRDLPHHFYGFRYSSIFLLKDLFVS